jgi:hypothetical protein
LYSRVAIANKKQKALTEEEKPQLFNLKYQKIEALTKKSSASFCFLFLVVPLCHSPLLF